MAQRRESPARRSRTDTRYDLDAFRRCKVEFLARTLIPARDGVVVWGAGPVGKGMARHLLARGVTIHAFIDLKPRKIGQLIHDVPVVAPAAIHAHRGALALAAVGSTTARAEIRAALDTAGWRELEDYCAVA